MSDLKSFKEIALDNDLKYLLKNLTEKQHELEELNETPSLKKTLQDVKYVEEFIKELNLKSVIRSCQKFMNTKFTDSYKKLETYKDYCIKQIDEKEKMVKTFLNKHKFDVMEKIFEILESLHDTVIRNFTERSKKFPLRK